MTKRLLAALGAAILAWAAVATAHAATLASIQGEVLVNQGGGYRFVSGTLELKPGDMVIANTGGAAQLSYGDGCTVVVEAGAVVTVAEQPPCLTTQATTPTTPMLTPGTLAVGAVVIGGAVGAAALLSSNSKDKPASP